MLGTKTTEDSPIVMVVKVATVLTLLNQACLATDLIVVSGTTKCNTNLAHCATCWDPASFLHAPGIECPVFLGSSKCLDNTSFEQLVVELSLCKVWCTASPTFLFGQKNGARVY
jgi:hypothetical protein